ncbi:MAG: hypothetical protein KDJ27_10160 [Gammaproteobacteria bacterium]|nr:hypothetical protein [Gammaproteobacteria bacterium]
MKQLFIAGVLAIATSAAAAQPFEFQRQFGSTEYVYDADTAHLTFAPVVPSGKAPSLTALMLASNVDGIAPHRFEGSIVKTGPTRISLYEVQRGSPEATAYQDYYAQYPADTDWAAVARAYREQSRNGALAAGSSPSGHDS